MGTPREPDQEGKVGAEGWSHSPRGTLPGMPRSNPSGYGLAGDPAIDLDRQDEYVGTFGYRVNTPEPGFPTRLPREKGAYILLSCKTPPYRSGLLRHCSSSPDRMPSSHPVTLAKAPRNSTERPSR